VSDELQTKIAHWTLALFLLSVVLIAWYNSRNPEEVCAFAEETYEMVCVPQVGD
jgi:hypothetical protein